MRPTPVVLLPLLVVLAAGCARRYPADAGQDREGISGVPMEFGARTEPVPEGTTVRWDFGDGSQATGQVVSHAFPRAGEYRVTMSVLDSGEPRSATATVRVLRRPPAAAVPPTARSAFVFDRLFARLPIQLGVIERLFGSERTHAAIEAAENILGVDPTRPEQLDGAGIDPEEGLVLCSLPDDTGTWIVTGIYDEEKALAAAKRSLAQRFGGEFVDAPHGFSAVSSGGQTAYVGTRNGYLYVRLPPSPGGEPDTANLAAFESAPLEGLFADATFATARRTTPGDDLFFHGQASELWKLHQPTGPLSRLQGNARAFSFGVGVAESQLTLSMLLSMDEAGVKSLGALFGPPPSLPASRIAPAGASAYVSATLAPDVLAELFRGEDKELEKLGWGAQLVRDVVGATDGALSAAIYFDVPGLYRDLAARQEPSPKFKFVGTAGVKDAATAKSLVVRRAEALAKGTGKKPPLSGDTLLVAWEGVPAGMSARGAAVIFGYGEPLKGALDESPEVRRLQSRLDRSVPANLLAGPHLLLYLDVASVLDELRSPAPIEDVSPSQLAFMRSMVATMLEDPSSPARPLMPVQDLLLHVAPGEQGLQASGTFRLRL